MVPPDKVDLAVMAWGAEVAGHHDVAASTQTEITFFFAALAGPVA
jgi:hypothetical protein